MIDNTWQKRASGPWTCSECGNQALVRRTGPDLAVKAGKFARVLQKVGGKKGEKIPLEEQLKKIEALPDNELEQLMSFARIVIADIVIKPAISLHPKEGQLGPDDVPLCCFWRLHAWATSGGPTLPVKTKEGETTVDAVETFPPGQGSSVDAGNDSEQIQ